MQEPKIAVTQELLKLIAEIDEFKGKWEALKNMSPERLRQLRKVATIESIGSSTRIPDHIRSDNGSEFTAKPIRAWLKRLGVKTLYIEPGSPWENGYNESFNGRFRDEFLKAEVLYSLKEAEVLSAQWRHLYNHIRPHSSLGYKPPAPLARAPRMAASTYADAPVADAMRSGGKVPIGGGLQNGG